MSTKTIRTSLILVGFFCGAALLGACAGKPPVATQQTLLGAGFRPRTPETPRQKEIYASLPAYKVHRLEAGGQTYYLYKVESRGVAFVGREAEYQRYRQMARQDRLNESAYQATILDDAAAQSWSSAYSLERDWR